MNRRTIFGLLFGGGVAAALPKSKLTLPTLVQLVDVHNGSQVGRYRAILDGEDVTNRYWRAELFSDGTGNVSCVVLDCHGKLTLADNSNQVKTEILTGKLEIVDLYEKFAQGGVIPPGRTYLVGE